MTLATTTIPTTGQRLRAVPGARLRRAPRRLASGGPLAADARAATPAPPPVALVASRPRVLLVEDDDALRALLAVALRRQGYAVTAVADGTTAVSHLMPWISGHRASPPPDAIVSDIRMPGWSGLELLTTVRDAGLHMPVLLITAFAAADTHAAAQRLGAVLVLDKPFEVDALCRLVRDALAPG